MKNKKVRASFVVTDVTPEIGMDIPGLFGPRVSTGVLDPLQARVCVIESGEKIVALIGVDAVSIRTDIVNSACKCIEEETGIPKNNIVIA
ncbi:MAG: hypothetical protein GX811_08595, partial [Lentisphaerae bacterium]|nr:hypothetical protein [Lentisphaerota bacterium]